MCKQLKWVLSWKISRNLFNSKAHCPACKTGMLLAVTNLAMQSTVMQIIHIYLLLSQLSTILFIVVFSDIIFFLRTLTSLIFHSVYPDYQLCKAYCSRHLQIISLKLTASSVDFMTLHCSLIALFDYIKT